MDREHAIRSTVAFLDQFIARGAERDVVDLRRDLVGDDETRARFLRSLEGPDVTDRQAFEAMRALVEERAGTTATNRSRDAPDLGELLVWTSWDAGPSGSATWDPAQWDDWLEAVARSTS